MSVNIPGKYQALIGFLVWGGVLIFLNVIRLDNFGLDEGAAMALLWSWSVSDQIVAPVTTYVGPDFRALLFLPLGFYWSGNIVAAKIFTLIVCFIAAMGLYHWSRQNHGEETALIATGLMLISPLTILLIDSMSSGPYLLALFGIAVWLDYKYRASPHSISSLYFIQLIVVAITITIHPMGLAYPVALAWHWHKNPKSDKQKKQMFIGLGVTSLIILVMQTGWISINWLANPLPSLAQSLLGYSALDLPSSAPVTGIIMGILLAFLLYKNIRALGENLMGTLLLCSVIAGLVTADRNWGLIAMVLVLYLGFPWLLQVNKSLGKTGFAGQRGIVLVVMMGLSIIFMQAAKAHSFSNQSGLLSPVDDLIKRLAEEAVDPDVPFSAASQWPARTLIVCRRQVFKLPPQVESGQKLLEITKGITHIAFDHKASQNQTLARNFTELTSETETVSVLSGGVIIKLKDNFQQLSEKARKEKRLSADKVLKKQQNKQTPAD